MSAPTTKSKRIHEYFERKTSEWSLIGFLNECNVEPFRRKIYCYLTSLENIANTEEGHRRDKAQQLIKNHKQQYEDLAKEWEKEHEADETIDGPFVYNHVNIGGGTFTSGSSKKTTQNRDKEESEDDFRTMPIHQPKRKNLSLSKDLQNKESAGSKKVKTTEDMPLSPPGVARREAPGEAITQTEQSSGLESAGSSRGAMEMTSFTSEINSPEYNKPRTPHQTRSTFENQELLKQLRQEKLRTESTYEQICSNIIDTTNKLLMDRLNIKCDYTWDPVINEAVKYIDELIDNSDTCDKFRRKLQLPLIPPNETYSFIKHYEMKWVHRFADKLLSFFDAPRNPLLKNPDEWLNLHILISLIDDCFLTCEEIQIRRGEEMSLASTERKNLLIEESEKRQSGNKIDTIFRIDNMEYFSLETYTNKDLQNPKPIPYKQKLFREMKDQLDRLLKNLKFTKESIKVVKNIVLHGITHGGLNGKIYAMYYDIDIGYYFVFKTCQYQIGTTWGNIPESLVALKDVLCLKKNIMNVIDVVQKVKRVALQTRPEDLFTINNLPETAPTPKIV